jgi:hypothetical protein
MLWSKYWDDQNGYSPSIISSVWNIELVLLKII